VGAIDSDGFRGSLWSLAIALVLLAAWLAWFFLARVERYEVTERARLEVDRAAHVLQSPVAGRVVESRITLGREVKAGDVLIELDASQQNLQLREERARLAALHPLVEAARNELAAQEKAQAADSDATHAAQEVARAQIKEGFVMADLAAAEARRDELLISQGLTSQRDAARSKAEAQSRRAANESLQLTIGRLESERIKNASDRETNRKHLLGEMARIEGDIAIAARTIERLELEIQRRKVRAPISGRFGEVPVLRTGSYLAEGDKLGAIVPAGRLLVIAEFLPAAALGRIHPGQPGRLRLDGFPWAQYGAIRAHVETVAEEVRDGRVRVELAIESSPQSTLPLQHGLPGTVEVRVEQVAPAALALRAAGQLLATPKSTFAPEPAR
jgi:multidrug resistance efflux pump